MRGKVRANGAHADRCRTKSMGNKSVNRLRAVTQTLLQRLKQLKKKKTTTVFFKTIWTPVRIRRNEIKSPGKEKLRT